MGKGRDEKMDEFYTVYMIYSISYTVYIMYSYCTTVYHVQLLYYSIWYTVWYTVYLKNGTIFKNGYFSGERYIKIEMGKPQTWTKTWKSKWKCIKTSSLNFDRHNKRTREAIDPPCMHHWSHWNWHGRQMTVNRFHRSCISS